MSDTLDNLESRIRNVTKLKKALGELDAFKEDLDAIIESQTDASQLEDFFGKLSDLGGWQFKMTGQHPKYLYINPLILQKLSKMDGFFHRQELSTQVTVHSPVISRMKFSFGVVEIIEDYEEPFLHFE